MNKRKKIDMSKLCLKAKPSAGVSKQISQFFASNEPSTSTSTEISKPLIESVNIESIQFTAPSIVDSFKSYEHTKAKMNHLAKRKSDSSSPTIGTFFDTSIADFESPKRIKPTVSKTKPKRTTKSSRSKQNHIKKLSHNNKTEETLFSELLAQQCATENVHPDELQMALALSKSLVETFSQDSSSTNDSNITKSTETKFSDIQKTLENFGFKTAGQYSAGDVKTILRVNKNYKWRRKFSKRNLDYIRKSFDEKLSMIFNENIQQNENEEPNEYIVSSKLLQELRISSEDTFFRLQSSDVHSSKLTDRYYSSNLFEISTVRNDFLLKNWDEIPGRTPSPIRRQQFDLSKITELSEDESQNILKCSELDLDSEITEIIKEKPTDTPLLARNCSRDVASPDLFSDSEAEPEEAIKSPPKPSEVFSSKTQNILDETETDNNSSIIHFENYTSEEAKTKDVVASKLSESNVDIFADLSVDMIDLTNECGSCEDDVFTSPSIEKTTKIVSQEDSVFTLSGETCISENSRSQTSISTNPVNFETLTEMGSILSNYVDNSDMNENNSHISDQFNTEDITLVYSDDENISEHHNDNLATSILISDDSEDDQKSIHISPILTQTEVLEECHSVLSFIELPHFSENTLMDPPIDTMMLSSPINQNFSIHAACEQKAKITQLTEEDDSYKSRELSVNLNLIDDKLNMPTSSNYNDTQNITLVFSEDEDYNENLECRSKPITLIANDKIDGENCSLLSNNISNGFKTPPRQSSILNLSDIELPNCNSHSEHLQNTSKNISDSIEISDDEINYSMTQTNLTTPNKTPEKLIPVDSDDESNLPDGDSNFLEKSMHSFLRRYENKISEDINSVGDDNTNDENNEVNKSVNEFLFKSRFESTVKRPNISSSKALLKRYPSEPNFTQTKSRTPKKLCFDQLKTDDEFDRLVFGEKINHDVVVLSPESPLREIPKSPEPVLEESLEDINCPYNYFQPDEEYDIILNQTTPKVNINGKIDLNETLYEGEKYIYKTRNVTPEPDYKNMDISILHVELKKFGLKKISRAKAIKLLEYIYNETHPIIQDTTKDMSSIDSDHHPIACSQPIKQTIQSPIKLIELPTIQPIGTWSGIDFSACDINVDYFKTDNFTLNLLNNNEMVYLPSKPRSGKIHYCSLPLHIAFFNLFRSNSKLRNALFMYQPIEVEKIYIYFKTIGVKYEMNDLISFLDRHCITFRTDPKNKTSGARTKNNF